MAGKAFHRINISINFSPKCLVTVAYASVLLSTYEVGRGHATDAMQHFSPANSANSHVHLCNGLRPNAS
jgi:hypothetical protein